MKFLFGHLMWMGFVLYGSLVWAGNKDMLEDNARELIRVNEGILQQLGHIKEAANYSLSARIVEHDGRRLIVIDQFQKQPLPPHRESNQGEDWGVEAVFDDFGENSSYVEYGPIPRSWDSSCEKNDSSPADDGIKQQVERLLKQQPNAQLKNLSPNELPGELKGKATAVLLYW